MVEDHILVGGGAQFQFSMGIDRTAMGFYFHFWGGAKLAKYHNKSIVWDGVCGQKVPNMKLRPPPTKVWSSSISGDLGFLGGPLKSILHRVLRKHEKVKSQIVTAGR